MKIDLRGLQDESKRVPMDPPEGPREPKKPNRGIPRPPQGPQYCSPGALWGQNERIFDENEVKIGTKIEKY